MSKQRNLLPRGNGKLGEGIHTWSIPAIDTCPGRTNLCESVCYARSGRFRTNAMQDRLQQNLDLALRADFERKVIAEINRRGVHTLRVHVSGDFFDPGYALKWVRIAQRSERTTLYAYTRSWRLPEFAEVLGEMAALANFKVWFSIDAESGTPASLPHGVKLAYLQTQAGDDPGQADVVFRIGELRGTPAVRIGLTVVCPTETGMPQAEDSTCTSCRRCYR